MENGSDRASNGPFDDDPQKGAAEAKAAMMVAIEAALGVISAAIQGAIGKIGSCLPIGTDVQSANETKNVKTNEKSSKADDKTLLESVFDFIMPPEKCYAATTDAVSNNNNIDSAYSNDPLNLYTKKPWEIAPTIKLPDNESYIGPVSKNAIPLQDWEYERSKLHNEPAEYKLQHFVNCLNERVVKYSAAIFGTIASASDGMTPEYSKLYGDFTTGMLFESGCTVAGSGIKSVSAWIRGEEVSKESVIAGSGIGNLGGKGNSAYKGVSNSDIVEVEISRSRYPESAKHIEDAIIANGQPEVLTIDRVGKKANRRASLKGIDKVPGEDVDEYPPAMFNDGGNGGSVRSINPSDNRGAGSSFGHKLRPYQNGTRIKFRITDD